MNCSESHCDLVADQYAADAIASTHQITPATHPVVRTATGAELRVNQNRFGSMEVELPFFSVIVPTRARPKRLDACLQALAALDYPRDRFEVIVVDDGSESPPETVVASLRDQLDTTLLAQRHAGPAAARNIGAMKARGQFLAFTDDDCAPIPDWLSALALRFATTPEHLIGGRTVNALACNMYSTATQLLVKYLYTHYITSSGQPRFFTSNNLALGAERFRKVGGFDTTFLRAAGEDREFCDRWQRHGYRVAYAPEVVVYHAHELTFRTFWRQHFNYGCGALRFHRLRAQRSEEPVGTEPPSFYLNLLRYPFSQVQGWRAWPLVGLLATSQVANAAGYFLEKAKQAGQTGT